MWRPHLASIDVSSDDQQFSFDLPRLVKCIESQQFAVEMVLRNPTSNFDTLQAIEMPDQWGSLVLTRMATSLFLDLFDMKQPTGIDLDLLPRLQSLQIRCNACDVYFLKSSHVLEYFFALNGTVIGTLPRSRRYDLSLNDCRRVSDDVEELKVLVNYGNKKAFDYDRIELDLDRLALLRSLVVNGDCGITLLSNVPDIRRKRRLNFCW